MATAENSKCPKRVEHRSNSRGKQEKVQAGGSRNTCSGILKHGSDADILEVRWLGSSKDSISKRLGCGRQEENCTSEWEDPLGFKELGAVWPQLLHRGLSVRLFSTLNHMYEVFLLNGEHRAEGSRGNAKCELFPCRLSPSAPCDLICPK